VYRTVLAAQHRAIQMIRPGVRYRDVHLAAATVIAEGLYDLGVFRSQPGEGRTAVVERVVREGVHAAFFPHGVGHLLGLDVHDMRDLGDLSGYEPGSVRSEQFGLHALRLDRTLRPGMVLTVEPGIYCNPTLLRHPRFASALAPDCEARLTGVRGIRIEDDVLVTEAGAEVLTQALPTDPAAVCALVGG
jgi:Xaa-Pro aminopeptidase